MKLPSVVSKRIMAGGPWRVVDGGGIVKGCGPDVTPCGGPAGPTYSSPGVAAGKVSAVHGRAAHHIRARSPARRSTRSRSSRRREPRRASTGSSRPAGRFRVGVGCAARLTSAGHGRFRQAEDRRAGLFDRHPVGRPGPAGCAPAGRVRVRAVPVGKRTVAGISGRRTAPAGGHRTGATANICVRDAPATAATGLHLRPAPRGARPAGAWRGRDRQRRPGSLRRARRADPRCASAQATCRRSCSPAPSTSPQVRRSIQSRGSSRCASDTRTARCSRWATARPCSWARARSGWSVSTATWWRPRRWRAPRRAAPRARRTRRSARRSATAARTAPSTRSSSESPAVGARGLLRRRRGRPASRSCSGRGPCSTCAPRSGRGVAQASPVSLLELVDRLHPTPAVGGAPREAALRWLDEHESGRARLVRGARGIPAVGRRRRVCGSLALGPGARPQRHRMGRGGHRGPVATHGRIHRNRD